jgi:hypothetical protein
MTVMKMQENELWEKKFTKEIIYYYKALMQEGRGLHDLYKS